MQNYEKAIFRYRTGGDPKPPDFGLVKYNYMLPEVAKSNNFDLVADDEFIKHSKKSKTKAVSSKTYSSSVTPSVIEPRALRREAAAAYLGVSPSYFDQLKTQGLIPGGRKLGNVMIWDRRELDQCLSQIFESDDHKNLWDILL